MRGLSSRFSAELNKMPYKILIVDDHALVRDALAVVVSSLPGGVQVHTAGNAAQALEQAELHTPFDAVLLDCDLPDADGGSLIQALSHRTGNAPVVVVSGVVSPDAEKRVLQLGAAAFVSKSKAASAVVEALIRVLALGSGSALAQPANTPGADSETSLAVASLTARQLDVLLMLDQGLINREIALQLGLSENTVRNHVTMLFTALGVSNRLHAIRKAKDAGLLK